MQLCTVGTIRRQGQGQGQMLIIANIVTRIKPKVTTLEKGTSSIEGGPSRLKELEGMKLLTRSGTIRDSNPDPVRPN